MPPPLPAEAFGERRIAGVSLMPPAARGQSFCMSIIKDAWPFSLSSWAELQLQMVISTLDWTHRLQATPSFPRGKPPPARLLAITGHPLL